MVAKMAPNNTIPANIEATNTPRGSGKRKRKRLDPSTSRVVVIGAGLAGLSTALSLRRAGFRNVDVYERDPSLEYQKEGYGLTLTYNPKGPLADLGVLEKVAQKDCPSRSHYLFRQEPTKSKIEDQETCNPSEQINDNAIPMGYFGNAFIGPSALRRGFGQRGNLRVPRKVLRRMLYDELLEIQQNQSEEDNGGLNNQGCNSFSSTAVHWNRSLVDFQWDASIQQYHLQFAELSSSPRSQKDPGQNCDASNTVTTLADLLVAADGIRSSVLQKLYNRKDAEEDEKSNLPNPSPRPPPPNIRENPERYGLRSMGIRLILGIANGIDHPLLRERGFYTVDTHGHRLFTMPYQSNRLADADDDDRKENRTSKNRIMWQLSFSTPSNPKTLDSASLREYVLETFRSWHPPVLDLVRSTPPASIWGTDLMDRNPRQVYQELIVGTSHNKGNGGLLRQPRLVVCGDALHSMSPFKGQGANQAFADGPPLAKWLSKSSIDAALTNWWRETLNRTAPVVEASRKAAKDWHDPNRILGTSEQDHQEYHGFAGVQPSAIPQLVEVLRNRKVGPHLGGDLDRMVREVIEEHGWFDHNGENDERETNKDQLHDEQLCERVLQLAAIGDTAGLRQMSLPSSGSNHRSCSAMVDARDAEGRSCLHLAAIGNHRFTCQWLLMELRIYEQWQDRTNYDGDPKDGHGKTACDYAIEKGERILIHMFETVLKRQ